MYVAQVESEGRHIAELKSAEACFELVDLMLQGLSLYESINSLDDDWHLLVHEKQMEYSETFSDRISRLYKDWFAMSGYVLEIYSQLETAYRDLGFDSKPVGRLQSAYRETKGMLTDDAEFFKGEKLVDLRDAAVDSNRRGDTCEMAS